MYTKTISVSALNSYIKKMIDNDFILSNSSIKGEISNLKLHSSGHMYFSLKDQYSKVNCIMFSGNVANLIFMPENGMKVIVKGRVSVYEKEGNYQLYCEKMELEGIGELYAAFEKLKSKLESEGLFLQEHKKELPKYVRKIGVVTSPTGAAIQDIINVARRRNNGVDILLFPAKVQGADASKELINGIEYLNKADVDVIILARGGGSIEELWAFNDADLAYAVYNSRIPVITGVGHETDFTIVDFVSDRRASTPSQACEIAVFDLSEANTRLEYLKNLLLRGIERKINERKNKLNLLRKRIELANPETRIINEYRRIEELKTLLNNKTKLRIELEKDKLERLNGLLLANNPLKILNKGYSIIQDEAGNVLSSVDSLKNTATVKITVKDGNVKAKLNICE